MTLPLFGAGDDPGPDFAALLHRTGRAGPASLPDPLPGVKGPLHGGAGPLPGEGSPIPGARSLLPGGEVRHGTTCLAIRGADGVVMAGDRRVTSGNFISHHAIEKVFPADRHSGVAIAGAAGPATEMVRLFQLQLEHYEKVEGKPISLEGKANQLSQMIRGNLPAAMQGLAVVPIFAGYDMAEGRGRIFEYDITGGRYEEKDYAATGSGALHAGTVIKLGLTDGMEAGPVVDLALEAMAVAAEEDAATGGPDPLRGIYPVVAAIGAEGYARLDDDDLRRRSDDLMSRRRSLGAGEGAGP